MKRQQFLEASLTRIWNDYQNIQFSIIIPSLNDNKNYSEITKTIKEAGYKYVRLEAVGQREINMELVPSRIPALLVKDIKDSDESIPLKFNMITNKFSPIEAAQFFSSIFGNSFILEGFKYADPPENSIHGRLLANWGAVDIFRGETVDKWRKKIHG